MTENLHTGDNLEFMKSLPSESIDLIYGDILYGTGRNFGDYQDIKADRKTVEEFYIPRILEPGFGAPEPEQNEQPSQ